MTHGANSERTCRSGAQAYNAETCSYRQAGLPVEAVAHTPPLNAPQAMMSVKAHLSGASLRNCVLTGTTCAILVSIALLLLGLSHHGTISKPGQDREQLEGLRREQFLGEDGLVRDLVYVSDRNAMERLACPQDHTLTCFYRFTMLGDDIKQPTEGLVTEEDCDAVFRALVADHADRPWCIRQVRTCTVRGRNIHTIHTSEASA